jgi:hypothetical protein
MVELNRQSACACDVMFGPSRSSASCCCPFFLVSFRRNPARRRQRCLRPGDKLIGIVEQPLRRAPKGEVYGAALLRVVEGRKGLGFLEDRPVVVINPEVERVVPHHCEHQPVAEHAGLAEHAPHRDAAEPAFRGLSTRARPQ